MPTPNAKKILCIGMAVRDLIFRIRDLPPRGAKFPADNFDEIAGGNGLNAAIGIARLGGAVLYAGPMGDASHKADAYIADQLVAEGIDPSGMVHMPGLVTPLSSIMIDPTGERTIVTYRQPELWKVKLPPADVLLKDCAAVLTENRCAEFVTDLCAEALRRGIPVVIDADQVMSLSEGLLRASSHLIFSAETLYSTAGSDNTEQALKRIARLTPSFVGVTHGAHGMSWLDRSGALRHMASFPVHTVDTLGAGDIFHGAFTLAIAEGQDIEQAMRFGAAAAALKCTRFGGAFAAPKRDEIEGFLRQSSKS
jgi:sugar/nucleoside kinase (ribokinase family)